VLPSIPPSDVPSSSPSDSPSTAPSGIPSVSPSVEPSATPSHVPSNVPSSAPSSCGITGGACGPSAEPGVGSCCPRGSECRQSPTGFFCLPPLPSESPSSAPSPAPTPIPIGNSQSCILGDVGANGTGCPTPGRQNCAPGPAPDNVTFRCQDSGEGVFLCLQDLTNAC